MANEILIGGLSSVQSQVADGEFLRLTAERSSLIMHPALYYIGDLSKRGSDTKATYSFGLDGTNLPTAAGSEIADGSNTALTDAEATVQVGRYTLVRDASDIARFTDATGAINGAAFAQDAVTGRAQLLVSLIAGLMSGFSNSVGTSGSDLTAEQFLEAKATLDANNASDGELLAVLHSRQWNDLAQDLYLTSGGGAAFDPATPELVRMRGSGYKGKVFGVDVFVSNRVPTANAGADRAGGMFSRGALGWADLSVEVENPAEQAILGGKVLYERNRHALGAHTQYVSHSYLGVTEIQDARGVAIVTDA